jgi:polyhydroxyalkanoate synthesis regulator phasin
MIASLEMIKKIFLVGVGASVLTAEKAKALVDELVEKGEVSKQDAGTFLDDLKERGIKERQQLEDNLKAQVETHVKNAMDKLGVVSKKDLDALREELVAHRHDN